MITPDQIYEIQVDDDEDEIRGESMDENDENQIDSEGDEDLLCPDENCEFRFSSKRILELHLSLHESLKTKSRQIQIKDFAKQILNEVPNTDEPISKRKKIEAIQKERPNVVKDLTHKKRSFNCEMCGKVFGSDFALLYHMKSACPRTEIIRKDLSAIQPLSNTRKNHANEVHVQKESNTTEINTQKNTNIVHEGNKENDANRNHNQKVADKPDIQPTNNDEANLDKKCKKCGRIFSSASVLLASGKKIFYSATDKLHLHEKFVCESSRAIQLPPGSSIALKSSGIVEKSTEFVIQTPLNNHLSEKLQAPVPKSTQIENSAAVITKPTDADKIYSEEPNSVQVHEVGNKANANETIISDSQEIHGKYYKCKLCDRTLKNFSGACIHVKSTHNKKKDYKSFIKIIFKTRKKTDPQINPSESEVNIPKSISNLDCPNPDLTRNVGIKCCKQTFMNMKHFENHMKTIHNIMNDKTTGKGTLHQQNSADVGNKKDTTQEDSNHPDVELISFQENMNQPSSFEIVTWPLSEIIEPLGTKSTQLENTVDKEASTNEKENNLIAKKISLIDDVEIVQEVRYQFVDEEPNTNEKVTLLAKKSTEVCDEDVVQEGSHDVIIDPPNDSNPSKKSTKDYVDLDKDVEVVNSVDEEQRKNEKDTLLGKKSTEVCDLEVRQIIPNTHVYKRKKKEIDPIQKEQPIKEKDDQTNHSNATKRTKEDNIDIDKDVSGTEIIKLSTCETCGKSFKKTISLQIHIQIVHEKRKKLKCEYCSKTFNRTCLIRHIKNIHEGKRNYKCDSCEKTFGERRNLETHFKRCHKNQEKKKDNVDLNKDEGLEPSFKCETCDKPFTLASNLKNHLKLWSHKAQFHNCEFCGKVFLESHMLKSHIDNVHKGIESKPDADSTSKTNDSLEISKDSTNVMENQKKEKNQNGVEVFTCKLCNNGFKFNQATKVQDHIKSVHEVAFSMNLIDISIDSIVETLGEDLNSKCTKSADEILSSLQNFSMGDEKPNSDNDTTTNDKKESRDKMYEDKVDIVDQNKIMDHENQLDYKCEICEKDFYHDINLARHLKNTHKIKEFACKICDENFFKTETLQKHIKDAHEKQQEYKCNLCDEIFDLNINLSRHLKYTHNQTAYERKMKSISSCPICKNMFPNSLINDHVNQCLDKPQPHKISMKSKDEDTIENDPRITEGSSNMKMKDVHTKKKEFKCKVCDEVFDLNINLARHLENTHCSKMADERTTKSNEVSSKSCNVCNKKYNPGRGRPSKNKFTKWLETHMREFHPLFQEEKYACKLCDETYTQPESLQDHIKYTHLKSAHRHKCSDCDEIFINQLSLKFHVDNVHKDETKTSHEANLVCDICDRSYISRDSLQKHRINIHKIDEVNGEDIAINGGIKISEDVSNSTNISSNEATIYLRDGKSLHASSQIITKDFSIPKCGKFCNDCVIHKYNKNTSDKLIVQEDEESNNVITKNPSESKFKLKDFSIFKCGKSCDDCFLNRNRNNRSRKKVVTHESIELNQKQTNHEEEKLEKISDTKIINEPEVYIDIDTNHVGSIPTEHAKNLDSDITDKNLENLTINDKTNDKGQSKNSIFSKGNNFCCFYDGCGFKFSSRSHLLQHYSKHDEGVTIVEEQSKERKVEPLVTKVLQNDQDSPIYSACPNCNKTYPTEKMLGIHISICKNIKSGLEKYQCGICYQDLEKKSLESHMRLHKNYKIMDKVLSEKNDISTDLGNDMEIGNASESQILNNTNEKDTLENTNSNPDLSNDIIEIIEPIKKEKLKPKTKIKITLCDGGKIYMVNIHKSPNTICLADLKNNMPISGRFRYFIKTCDEDGDILFKEYDDNTSILPLFKDKIIVECKPVL